jgi:hypothetical protein
VFKVHRRIGSLDGEFTLSVSPFARTTFESMFACRKPVSHGQQQVRAGGTPAPTLALMMSGRRRLRHDPLLIGGARAWRDSL